jgi:hypothetical protein
VPAGRAAEIHDMLAKRHPEAHERAISA